MSKLGIYLVQSESAQNAAHELKTYTLVLAESASQAADKVAFRNGQPYERTDTDTDVGRIGDYEPGLVGHSLASILSAYHESGAIVMREIVPFEMTK